MLSKRSFKIVDHFLDDQTWPATVKSYCIKSSLQLQTSICFYDFYVTFSLERATQPHATLHPLRCFQSSIRGLSRQHFCSWQHLPLNHAAKRYDADEQPMSVEYIARSFLFRAIHFKICFTGGKTLNQLHMVFTGFVCNGFYWFFNGVLLVQTTVHHHQNNIKSPLLPASHDINIHSFYVKIQCNHH